LFQNNFISHVTTALLDVQITYSTWWRLVFIDRVLSPHTVTQRTSCRLIH